jgi:peptidoglycan hydrolase CwlO-like protein
MQYEYEGTISTLKNKVDSLVSRNNIVEREIISIKESMTLKEKEIKNLQERVRVTEER